MNIIGENIRLYRSIKGYSQEYLGTLINKSQNYIHKVESGKVAPDTTLLLKIAECLNVSLKLLETQIKSNSEFNGTVFQAKKLEITEEQYLELRKDLDEIKLILINMKNLK